MRHRAIGFAALLGAAALPVAGSAAEPPAGSAQLYLPFCKAALDDKNTTELFNQGECVGMLKALSFVSEELSPAYRFCSPADVSGAQLAQVAVRYLDKSPNRLGSPVLALAIEAFRAEWPCKK